MSGAELLEDIHAKQVRDEKYTAISRIYLVDVLRIAWPTLIRAAAAGNVQCKEACKAIESIPKPPEKP